MWKNSAANIIEAAAIDKFRVNLDVGVNELVEEVYPILVDGGQRQKHTAFPSSLTLF